MLFTAEQQRYLVVRLARLDFPRQIVADFNAINRAEIREDDLRQFNPDSGIVLPPDLHFLFNSTRKQICSNLDEALFAGTVARVVALSKMALYLIGNNQFKEARETLKQIQEETESMSEVPGQVNDAVQEIVRRIIDPKDEQ